MTDGRSLTEIMVHSKSFYFVFSHHGLLINTRKGLEFTFFGPDHNAKSYSHFNVRKSPPTWQQTHMCVKTIQPLDKTFRAESHNKVGNHGAPGCCTHCAHNNIFHKATNICRKCVVFKVKAFLLHPGAKHPKCVCIFMCIFQDMFHPGPNVKTTLRLLIPSWRTITHISLAVWLHTAKLSELV